MSLIDPSGLLQRMPELEAVALADAPVRAALATGDAFKLYRVLRWRSWTGKLSAHKDVVRELLGNRRLFARPIKSSPSLHTVNSLGTNFVGESEVGADGTYIANHCLVIFFKVPLLPLGSYLVGAGDTTNSYRIFARVPQGAVTWAWSRGVALATALLVVSAAWGAFMDSRYATVHVANGFKKPLEATLGDQHVTVAPSSTQTARVRVGTQPTRATIDGKVVEEGPMEVESGHDAFVWNVGGVAPIFTAQIKYYAVTPANEEEPQETYSCGQNRLVVHDVDYLFREPDKSVSLGKGQQVAVRTMLGAAWHPDATGLPDCYGLLSFRDDEQGLKRVTQALVAAGELAVPMAMEPVTLALYKGRDADAWAWANELHARGFDPTIERLRAWVADETGHLDEVAKELEARSAEHPDDGELAALAVFSRGTPPTLASLEPLLEKFPKVDRFLEGAQVAAGREGEHDRSVDLWLRRVEAGSAYACTDNADVVGSALHAGREKDVLAALEDCLQEEQASVTAVVLAAMALDQAQHRDPKLRLGVLEKDPVKKRTSLLAGLPVDGTAGTALEPLAKLVEGAGHGSADLLTAVAALPPLERKWLDEELALIAWTEAVARHHVAEQWLERHVRLRKVSREALRGFITGGTKELSAAQLLPLARAAAYLARGEVDGVSADEKQRLRALGKKEAVGSRFLLAALERWP